MLRLDLKGLPPDKLLKAAEYFQWQAEKWEHEWWQERTYWNRAAKKLERAMQIHLDEETREKIWKEWWLMK